MRYRELCQKGIGAVVHHAPVVEESEEEALWDNGILGDSDAVGSTMRGVFYVGKAFCLRGGEEQRALKKSQLVRSYDPDCYTVLTQRLPTKLFLYMRPRRVVHSVLCICWIPT